VRSLWLPNSKVTDAQGGVRRPTDVWDWGISRAKEDICGGDLRASEFSLIYILMKIVLCHLVTNAIPTDTQDSRCSD
jgi:hypothetical protein